MPQPNWITPTGVVNQTIYSLGNYGSNLPVLIQLEAEPIAPAVSITYKLLSGDLPSGLTINTNGLISGIPTLVTEEITSTFTVRATDNQNYLRDRTFNLIITGVAIPSFVTPDGGIIDSLDSIWISYNLLYNNPEPNNTVTVRIIDGVLPPGLEMNDQGLIRGYAEPPTINTTSPEVITAATITETTNIITCVSTTGFTVNRPVIFTGTAMFGSIIENQVYYIKSVINSTSFTISTTPNGSVFILSSGTGFMTVTLPSISVGQPTKRTYNFTLKLESLLGNDIGSYSITIRNQNLSITQGGPGYPPNTRVPAILNTRPRTFNLNNNNLYYGYYLLPPIDTGYDTYPLIIPAYIGNFSSADYFAFKVIGYDFDSAQINYLFLNLPLGLSGDVNTGWVTGTPTLLSTGINEYGFSVAVYKTSNPGIQTVFYNFNFTISNNLTRNITWITSNNLGYILNGTVSTKKIQADADVDLSYRLTSGSLPPNLVVTEDGEIRGYVAYQPSDDLLPLDEEITYTFEIEAYSKIFNVIKSTKTFSLTVKIKYITPIDTLYIKATPGLADRRILESLLTNNNIFPIEYLYRPDDINFGKAKNVIYEHAYGINVSTINEYIAAVTRNHYWKNITLGEIKTAVAKNENNEILYEVVYSEVIDNLVNPEGVSVSQDIYWPRPINLFLGPWYTSVTNIFTSYENVLGQEYYTSLSPGSVRELYPNSLFNMRNRVGQELGQEFDSSLLPLWMTSQQANGSTLGYTQAWVICYTKPGYSNIIKNNINTLWLKPEGIPYKLNLINFKIDRFSVDKSLDYNFDKENIIPPAWLGLPSATPVPDPIDSKDFYVLFPRKTILPDTD